MSSKEGTGDDAAPKKKSKKLMIIVLGAVLLLGGGGGAFFLMGSGGEAEAEPKPEPGVVIPLDAVTINLADGHYLKIKIALQATAEVHEEPDGSKALDRTIAYFSDRKIAELSSAEGRKKAKEELVHEVEEAYEGEIMDIYFTEFVMQ
jgi:flagellar FliL protein